jgi:hypothetical protein
MTTRRWVAALLLSLIACGQRAGAEPAPEGFLQRLGPAGGWHPYGGGLLHWWPRHCFPHCGGPDDYCRKTLPWVCWPAYPPYYVWGPPDSGCPRENCRPASRAEPSAPAAMPLVP